MQFVQSPIDCGQCSRFSSFVTACYERPSTFVFVQFVFRRLLWRLFGRRLRSVSGPFPTVVRRSIAVLPLRKLSGRLKQTGIDSTARYSYRGAGCARSAAHLPRREHCPFQFGPFRTLRSGSSGVAFSEATRRLSFVPGTMEFAKLLPHGLRE